MKSNESGRTVDSIAPEYTIMLVDADIAIVKLISNFLARNGFGVLSASSSEEAIAVAEAHLGRIDLLLTEVLMTGMLGTEIAAYLLTRRPGIKVMYMSGYLPPEIQDEIAASGSPIFTKPFALAQLAKSIRTLLGREH